MADISKITLPNGNTYDLQGKVKSVNGQTGAVVLKTSDITNDSGYVTDTITTYNISDTTYGNYAIVKTGVIKQMTMNALKSLTPGAWTNIFILQEEYRPTLSAYFLLAGPSGEFVNLYVRNTGVVSAYNYTSNTGTLNISANIVYI